MTDSVFRIQFLRFQLIEKEKLDHETKEYYDLMYNEMKIMNNVINQVAQYVEVEEMQLSEESSSINDILDSALSYLKIDGKERVKLTKCEL